MQNTSESASPKPRSHVAVLAGALTFLAAMSPSLTETAIANGETRTIHLYHTHTHEQIAAAYLVNGQYDRSVLQQLNWFLRDWRRDEPTNMDPRLFDVVWEAYRNAGAAEPIQVVSAYRSPETNAMLRRRSRGVAKYSQHMLGKAMDTTMPGMPMERIREIGMRMQRGGVGYYPTAGTPFVHLDVGSVRSWPRMTYEQLVRLFPDGKTVHLPANGQPLARYEEARAEIEANGGGAYVPPERKSRGLFAFLFGGGGRDDDEDSGEAAPPPSTRKQWASLAPRGPSGKMGVQSDEEGQAPEGPGGRHEALARAESNLPRGETALTPGPAASANGPAAASAPVPPNRPATLASLETADPARDGAPDEQEAEATAPIPPRRPANLASLAASAPLPPVRPAAGLAALMGDPPAETKKGAGATNALARLIDVTGSAGTGFAARTGFAAAPAGLLPVATPGSSRQDEPPQPPQPAGARPAEPSPDAALAYAAPASLRDASRETHAEAPTGLRAAAAKSASANLIPPRRPDLVPARLDRSNFHAMTGATPASRVDVASILGSALGAPRSAARADPSVLTNSPQATSASHFEAESHEPPIGAFALRDAGKR